MMKNIRIYNWFDNGEFKNALLGQGKYKIPDYTYPEEHDRLLVINQLINWVSENLKEYSTMYYEDLIKSLITERFEEAVDILLCYFINNKSFPLVLNYSEIKKVLLKEIKNHGKDIAGNSRLRNQLIQLKSYIPDIY